MKYIIELEKDLWVAEWSGDPGRTKKREYAKVFNSYSLAVIEVEKISHMRKFQNIKIVDENE